MTTMRYTLRGDCMAEGYSRCAPAYRLFDAMFMAAHQKYGAAPQPNTMHLLLTYEDIVIFR